MALIAIASDKGAPGVTTAALALAAVWPRAVLLAECDPAGGDLAFRFPAADGGHLDPRRGVLSLAVAARRGMQPNQVWEHVQKLHGGLDVLTGVTNADQGAGLNTLWGPIGKLLASLPQADVIADCGRLGAEGPLYDLLTEATTAVLISRVGMGDVVRLRDRAAVVAAAAQSRGRRGFGAGVLIVADASTFKASLPEVQHVLGQANAPAVVIGRLADDPKSAALLSGGLSGKVGKTALIKTAKDIAAQLVAGLPPAPNAGLPPAPNQPAPGASATSRHGRHHAAVPQPSPQQPPPQQPPLQQPSASQPPAFGTEPQQRVALHGHPTPSPSAQAGSAVPSPQGTTQGSAQGAAQDDWAGPARSAWRERERQQSGGE
jgi:hypothetical protein